MLSIRGNGSAPGNIVKAAWWNDFYNLLTGNMKDQQVTIANNLVLQASLATAPGSGAFCTTVAGGNLGLGNYQYVTSFVTGSIESQPSPAVTVTTSGVNTSVVYQSIQTGPVGTTARIIYRTKLNSSTFYFLTQINDNTTTTFTDTLPDVNLSTNQTPVGTAGFAGKLMIRDQAGNTNLTINPDGSLVGVGSAGVTVMGNLTVSNGSTYLASTSVYGTLDMKNNPINNVTTLSTTSTVNIGGNINIAQGMTITASTLSFAGNSLLFSNGAQVNGTFLLSPGNTASPSVIQIGTAGMGIKNNGGTKLFELKNNGTTVISGPTYFSAGGTGTVGGGGTFDGFDVAETSLVDQQYSSGVMVCPADTTTPIPYDATAWHQADRAKPMMTQCTHDGCNLAAPISVVPAFCAGSPNTVDSDWYDPTLPIMQALALIGRVFIRTAYDIPGRVYVTSDGRGGVRQVQPGEKVYSIGVTLSPTSSGMVAVLVRPSFVSI